MSLPVLTELNRRRVFRALVGYGIAAFAVLQIIEPVMHGLRWPESVLSYVVVALGAGFPIVVTLAWIFDVNAGRIERTAPAAGRSLQGGRLWLLLAGIGVAAAAPGITWYFIWPGKLRTPAAGPSAASIAVLPFLNVSNDPGQDYFSDGITEEIISKLSRLRGLSVAARTSVARFKSASASPSEIGSALGVAWLLEGSVRRAGDHIRVTTTLLKSADGFQVWSDDSDARLDDIFAVQQRIATRTVDALALQLSAAERSSLSDWGTHSAAAYDEYLQGQVLLEHWHLRDRLDSAHAHFDRALAIDPAFAPALAGAASAEAQIYRNFDSDPRRLERAESLVARAMALDPHFARARTASGEIRAIRYDYPGASALFRETLADEPRNYLVWDLLCWSLGYQHPPPLAEAEDACRHAQAINPSYAESWYHLERVLVLERRIPEAEQALKHLEEHFPGSSLINSGRFWLLMSMGRPREALDAAERSVDASTPLSKAWAAMALAQAGETDRALARLEAAVSSGYRDAADLETSPYFESLRRDPRFAALLARHGLTKTHPGR